MIEDVHEVTCRLPSVIYEHLAVFLAYWDEELMDGHRRVNSNFAAKEGFDVVFLLDERVGRVILIVLW